MSKVCNLDSTTQKDCLDKSQNSFFNSPNLVPQLPIANNNNNKEDVSKNLDSTMNSDQGISQENSPSNLLKLTSEISPIQKAMNGDFMDGEDFILTKCNTVKSNNNVKNNIEKEETQKEKKDVSSSECFEVPTSSDDDDEGKSSKKQKLHQKHKQQQQETNNNIKATTFDQQQQQQQEQQENKEKDDIKNKKKENEQIEIEESSESKNQDSEKQQMEEEGKKELQKKGPSINNNGTQQNKGVSFTILNQLDKSLTMKTQIPMQPVKNVEELKFLEQFKSVNQQGLLGGLNASALDQSGLDSVNNSKLFNKSNSMNNSLQSDFMMNSYNQGQNIIDFLLVCQQPGCNFETNNFNSFRSHQRQHKQSAFQNFKCEKCGFQCKKISYLDQHIKINHSEKNHTCEICKKGNMSKLGLYQHQREVHSTKVFKCDICENKSFKTKGSYNWHMRYVHSQGKYKCEKCKYSTVSKEQMQSHNENHHQLFSCQFCDFVTGLKKKYHEHLHEEHQNLQPKTLTNAMSLSQSSLNTSTNIKRSLNDSMGGQVPKEKIPSKKIQLLGKTAIKLDDSQESDEEINQLEQSALSKKQLRERLKLQEKQQKILLNEKAVALGNFPYDQRLLSQLNASQLTSQSFDFGVTKKQNPNTINDALNSLKVQIQQQQMKKQIEQQEQLDLGLMINLQKQQQLLYQQQKEFELSQSLGSNGTITRDIQYQQLIQQKQQQQQQQILEQKYYLQQQQQQQQQYLQQQQLIQQQQNFDAISLYNNPFGGNDYNSQSLLLYKQQQQLQQQQRNLLLLKANQEQSLTQLTGPLSKLKIKNAEDINLKTEVENQIKVEEIEDDLLQAQLQQQQLKTNLNVLNSLQNMALSSSKNKPQQNNNKAKI